MLVLGGLQVPKVSYSCGNRRGLGSAAKSRHFLAVQRYSVTWPDMKMQQEPKDPAWTKGQICQISALYL